MCVCDEAGPAPFSARRTSPARSHHALRLDTGKHEDKTFATELGPPVAGVIKPDQCRRKGIQPRMNTDGHGWNRGFWRSKNVHQTMGMASRTHLRLGSTPSV